MAVTTTNLGVITAYGDAVAAGYTGTKAEWQALMASYATVGQQAVDAKDDAVAAKNTAVAKATEATTAATTATTKASEASASSQSIAQSAAQIQENTDDISQLKSELTALAPKEDMLKAFPTDSAQGAVASFSDGAELPLKSLVVDIDPVQDLHGQANPYPAGGGKNLFDGNLVSTSAPANWDVSFAEDKLTIVHKNDWSSGIPIFTLNLASGTYVVSYTSTQSMKCSLYVDGTYSIMLNNGTSFAVEDGKTYFVAFGADANSTNVFTNFQLEAGSTATAYAPYSNICPISGWGEVNVEHTGANVWDEEWIVASNNRINSKNPISVVSGGSYYFKTPVIMYINAVDKNGAYVSHLGGVTNGTMVIPDGVKYIGFSILDSYGTTYNHDISINYPSTDHDYHPYSGQSINIQLGQTVYGGTLDVTNGVLTTYPYYASYNGETLTGAWISDRDKYVSGATPTTGAQVVNIGGAGTDVQLDPHEVAALLGANNVWADSGDSEVTYRADPTLYIQRLTEPDADMVADANIVSGQYFMVGNTLYKATANIASGGAITPNVNCTRKSLSEALNELNV